MSYVGDWKFDSIGTFNDEGQMIWMNAQEYIDSPIPYAEDYSEDEIAHEREERKRTTGTLIRVQEDGFLYMLMPVGEGISEEEIEETFKSGEIKVMYGKYIYDRAQAWEERNGELWYDSGMSGEIFGEKTDSWTKLSSDDGSLMMITMKFVRA